jgi:hypothetical protein
LKARVKQFEIPLDEAFYVAVEIKSLGGQITDFVVRLMKKDDPSVNVVRYDTAHQIPHRDVLGRRRGLLRKDWLTGMSLREALQFAIRDVKGNCERYDQIFESN